MAWLSPAQRAILASAAPVLDRLCEDHIAGPVERDGHVTETGQER